MKPKYIFIAVFAICILMMAGLPQVARTNRAEAANAAPLASAALSSPTAAPTALPTLPPFSPDGEQPAAAQSPAETNPSETIDQTAQTDPAEAPASSSTDNLPSPVDPEAVPGQAQASIPATSSPPELAAFVSSVSNGHTDRLAGVYVQGQFAMPVEQQPDGDVNFVSSAEQTVTEYIRSEAFGVVGLLAHNTLSSGQEFFKLKPGQEVILVYGDGRQVRYQISHIENYQALSPTDPFSDFVDLNGPGGNLVRNEDLFRRIYTVSGQLVFQTCFTANGDPSWGRMFVIANPI